MRKTLSLLMLLVFAGPIHSAGPQAAPSKVIFDTDIGDDIDDAYALAFLLRSPEIKVLGITTAFGDTHLRARLVTRFLSSAEHTDIPVYEGPRTAVKSKFSQRKWAEGAPDRPYPDAIEFILDTIRKNPGQITLVAVAVAPLTNVGVLIVKDPVTFSKLKRVVIMGGSIEHGYGDKKEPDAEWNIVNDVPAAKTLFKSGVPLYLMPLDSTRISLSEAQQTQLFSRQTGTTKALEELTAEWSAATSQTSPTLFDPVAAVYTLKSEICPTMAMRIEVDDKGFTRKVSGPPNANVCLHSTPDQFFNLFLPRAF
jgi:purine nucleosidase